MILDDERQRKALLEMISAMQFPGTRLHEMHALDQAIRTAKVATDTPEPLGEDQIPTGE